MRTFPAYGWFGLLVIAISQAGVFARIEPFYHWHTPIAWTAYILLVDAFVWKRRSNSWIRNNRSELFFVACASVPLWVVFEMYNKFSIFSWYYVGLPELRLVRGLGYAWSFATITPAIFETGDLVSSVRDRRASPAWGESPTPQQLGGLAWTMVALGAAMVLIPVFVHAPYLAASVWLGFILLLDPLNARAGAESIVGDWRAGRSARLVNLLVAGLVCGIVWEFWNFWVGTKWIYNVPILSEVKIFEMPILGFGGFPPFAVECFAMYVTVRRLFWRGAPRPIAI
jgi:hypothetical protein